MKCQKLRQALALMGLASLVACGEGLEPTSRITKARIIGAQSTVQGDPSRTNARPGETLDVALFVTQPGAPTLNTWTFLVCTPAPTSFGVPRCGEGEPIGVFSAEVPIAEAPAFSVQIPEDTQGDLLFVGGVCMGGELGPLDGEDDSGLVNPCADVGVGRLVTGALRVQVEDGPEFVNHAPQIESISLRGEPWTAPPAPDAETCSEDMPRVSFSSKDVAPIEVFPSADSREILPAMTEALEEEREELPVAFFATERGLAQFYSVIDERRAYAETEFDTRELPAADSESIPVDGRPVRFEFVMRDGRGGVDRASRGLCLMP